MGSTSISFSVLLAAILAVSSLIMVESASAQSIPTPAVPEFTLTLISSPPDSHFVNKTIELAIKNQPSFPKNGFFYNVRIRINDDNWGPLYPNNNSVPNQSDGEYTILSYSSGYLGVEYQYHLGYKVENLTADDKIDFQVQAMVGSIHRVFNPNATNQLEMYPYIFSGGTSDWSNTQTITIPETSTSPSPNPTPTPTIPELSLLAIFPLFISLLSLGLLYRKHRKTARLSAKLFHSYVVCDRLRRRDDD
jgi:hypothetical protein